ncbi:tail fiber domain-containing protein [Janthinobacterium sp. HSC-3S05]|uniref:tail fiber domain-containing protein n=1 Tax=Janthinobacterium lividum TaxID=29581 RepID=UPI001CD9112E|nr:tail fiber domain-containing protein [Janthinobacterium lividum]MCA1859319.1 tail fiber domain-containing protein [Janthinobacterium lividum]
MPRNGTGSYLLPSGINPVTDGTVISASWANPTLTDIALAITGSLPRDGQAPMLGPLKLADGSVSSPGISWNSDGATGLFRPATATLGFTAGGIEQARFTAGNLLLGSTTNTGEKLQVTGATKFVGPLAVSGALTAGSTAAFTGVVTAPTFVGALTGNATTATNAVAATSATLAAKASTLLDGVTGRAMTFNWAAGVGAMPTWVWGGTDGLTMNVFNPSNFSVNYANSAGSATTAVNATNANTLGGYGSDTVGTVNAIVRRDSNGRIEASGAGGFASSSFVLNGRNPIWRFANSDGYGLSYFQGTSGNGGSDSIGIHFSTATGAGSQFSFNQSGNLTISGQFIGSGSELTGYASKLTAAKVVSIADAVNKNYTWTGRQYFQNNMGASSYLGAISDFVLSAGSSDGGAAAMTFIRTGSYAVNMGLDPDNVFRIGGYTAAANRLQMDMSGNLTMAGNVSAYSDARLKKNWTNMPTDFVERWAKVQAGTYERIDSGEIQVGLAAQDVQEIMPNATPEMADGYLALNYGGAAAVATVELAKEVIELRKLVKLLMEKVGAV